MGGGGEIFPGVVFASLIPLQSVPVNLPPMRDDPSTA